MARERREYDCKIFSYLGHQKSMQVEKEKNLLR